MEDIRDERYQFELGKLVVTPGAKEALGTDGIYEILDALYERHAMGDWGDISDNDKESNDEAVKTGNDMIMSAYEFNGTRFWIITEHDRSATTILLPGEK